MIDGGCMYSMYSMYYIVHIVRVYMTAQMQYFERAV